MEQPPTPPAASAPADPAAIGAPALASWPHSVQMAVAVLLALGIGILLGRHFDGSAGRPDGGHAPLVEARRPSLDLNRATRAELAMLPGLGQVRAREVEEFRAQHGPFHSVDDLRKVPGIGPKTLEKLRPALFVAEAPPAQAAPAVRAPSAPGPRSKKDATLAGPIDINHAGATELQKLPGIKAKMAQRILDERTLRGPFRTVDDLRRVSGIGPKILAKLRPYVVVAPAVEVAGK